MKKTVFRIGCVLAVSAVAVFLSGCRKDLCRNHYREARIVTDWEYVWERDYGRGWQSNWAAEKFGMDYAALEPVLPDGISMFDYDSGGNATQNFLSTAGDAVVLSEGYHSFLLYNNDTEYIVFNDMATLPTASATTTTRTRASFVNQTGDRTVNPPDVLYGAFVEEVSPVEIHQSVRVSVTMRPLVYTYLVCYEFDSGADYIALARGALSGMAESVYLRDGRTGESTVTVLYDCTLTPWGAKATVHSFGVPNFPDQYYKPLADGDTFQQKYILNLEIRLHNGKTKTFEQDVTDQMRDQPRGGVIVISGLSISEEEIGSDSGFDVSVGDWGEFEDITLPLNTSK